MFLFTLLILQDWVPSQQYGMTFYGCDPSMFDEDEIECDEIDYAMKNQGNMGYHGNSGSESPVSQKTLTSVSSRDSLEDVKVGIIMIDGYSMRSLQVGIIIDGYSIRSLQVGIIIDGYSIRSLQVGIIIDDN